MRTHVALVAGGLLLLFGWLFAGPLLGRGYLAESDLYEYYLPIFVSPVTVWSSYEFAGLPAFADPGDSAPYPLHFLFARIIGSWAGFAMMAYVLGAAFTYAYVYGVTRSRAAALFSGLAFGLSEAMLERLPHMATLHVLVWLPLILLAIDRLAGPSAPRWLAVGAFALGSCWLAGHPQPAIYIVYTCVLYALVGGIAERRGRRYFVAALGLFALGTALAAVKLVPLVEASAHLARTQVSFDQFASRANSPAQLVSALFPAIAHDGREAPTYVGLATLVFAAVGALLSRRHWRAAFWVATVLFAVLVGLGEHTPVARLAYHLPLYDKFRVGARHLFLAAFGAAVLAGFGLDAVARRRVPAGRLAWSVAGLAALLAGAALYLVARPEAVQFEARHLGSATLPALVGQPVSIQLAIGAVAALAALGLALGRRRRIWAGVLLVVLIGDLLHSQYVPLTPWGLGFIVIPAATLEPSVHARTLAAELAPRHQRLLAVGGTQRDAVAPGAFARKWRVPTAGGYGPMLLARHARLSTMGTNGAVRPSVLTAADVALDLLAVRYVLVKPEDVASHGEFQQDGLRWERRPLELPIGRPDCGYPYPRSTSLWLPEGVVIASVALVAHLRCAEDVPQGTEVATLSVVGRDGQVHDRRLRAGDDIAEAALAEPDVLRRAKHRPARRFADPDAGPRFEYLTTFDLPRPVVAARLDVRIPGMRGWLTISRLTLVAQDGRVLPQSAPSLFLRDGTRWREIRRFSTSRVTDRHVDVEAAGEETYTVYENLRALPRAWMVPQIVRLSEDDSLQAVRTSQLPDGRPFDPRTMALVDTTRDLGTTFATGAWSLDIEDLEDGAITLSVSTEGGGFLVLSESSYPGWRARIGAARVPVYRVNVSLQGIVVPPGRHRVSFEFAPLSLRAGALISLLGLAAVVLLGMRRGSP